jgi:hypothetical protein
LLVRRCEIFALTAFICTSLSVTAAAQEAGRQPSSADSAHVGVGRILGIIDGQTSRPIDSAEVSDLLAGVSYHTGRAGLIALGGFATQHGTMVVRVRKIGYPDTAFVVLAGPRDTTPITLIRDRARTLERVFTTAGIREGVRGPLAGFVERANDKSLHGTFFTPEIMRKNDGRLLVELIHPALLAMAHGCRTPTYYLAGAKAPPIEELPRDVHAYSAVEVYSPSSAPTQFHSDGCGVVLLWTRVR